ncbi:MAG: LacI family transcriptional regulator [Clostridia bacterium]|nr:LacI family transcriptional regulator [Clostridia bacterium]
MNVNIYDVAKKSGLSVVTVSRVINNSPNVRDYNRKKVLQAMAELGYNPSAAARSLAKGKTGVVGLLIPSLNDTFFNCVVRSVNEHLMQNGYFLAISLAEYGDNTTKEGTNFLFQEKRVDGIIILTPLNEEKYILEMKRKNIPFVLMDNQNNHPSVCSINVDNYKGGCDVTKHLLDFGHEKIGYIGAPEFYLSSKEREKGFVDTLRNEGIEPYAIDHGDFDIRSGYEITKQWIESGKIPTAIFAADDHIAFGAMDAIREAGMNVPEDISVCGYDDDFLSSQIHPALTTVRQPAEELGAKGVEILMQLIDGSLKRSVNIKLEPTLIIRQSTSKLKS